MTAPGDNEGKTEAQSATSPSVLTRTLLGCLLGALALLCAVVLQPFVTALVWAAVLAYVTWPGYRVVRRLCRQRSTLAASLMTLLIALCCSDPSWLAILLQDQIGDAYQAVRSYGLAGGDALPAFLRKIPWLGDVIQRAVNRYAADPLLMRQLLVNWAQRSRTELLGLIGNVGP